MICYHQKWQTDKTAKTSFYFYQQKAAKNSIFLSYLETKWHIKWHKMAQKSTMIFVLQITMIYLKPPDGEILSFMTIASCHKTPLKTWPTRFEASLNMINISDSRHVMKTTDFSGCLTCLWCLQKAFHMVCLDNKWTFYV